jgi:hypothetical protein
MSVVIAAGLPGLEFKPGIPLPERESGKASKVVDRESDSPILPIDRIVGTVVLVLVAAVILIAAARVIRGLRWKELKLYLLKALALVAGVAIALFFILRSLPPLSPESQYSLPPPESRLSAEDAAPQVGSPPAILLWLAAFAAAVLVIALCWRLATDKRKSAAAPSAIAIEAETARLALLEGKNFKDVITLCYKKMSRAMEKKSGIERQASTTAREFETMLENEGIPLESVHRLTLLFEEVRYGDCQASRAEEAEAITCLEAIEGYARKGKARS